MPQTNFLVRTTLSQFEKEQNYRMKQFLESICAKPSMRKELLESQYMILDKYCRKLLFAPMHSRELMLHILNATIASVGICDFTSRIYEEVPKDYLREILVDPSAPTLVRKQVATFLALGALVTDDVLPGLQEDLCSIAFSASTPDSCFKAHLVRLVIIIMDHTHEDEDELQQAAARFYGSHGMKLQEMTRSSHEEVQVAATEALSYFEEVLEVEDGDEMIGEYELENGESIEIVTYAMQMLFKMLEDILGFEEVLDHAVSNQFIRILLDPE